MKVYKKDTEAQLYKDLKTHWEQFPANRCLQLKFSQIELDQEDWFEILIAKLQTILDLSACQIYLCHDNDVFILSRHLTGKAAKQILSSLTPQLIAPASLKGLAPLFEIGVDWPKLRTLCEKKMEHIRLLESQKNRKEKKALKTATTEETLSMVDQSLVKSLSHRRAQRDEIEILIVEDDPFSQKLVTSALRKKYSVSATDDGQGAILTYLSKAPDVVFLDIGLPDMSGHDVLEKIFDLDPEAYIVMFSGNGDRENVMKAVELGAKGFVGKPFTQEKMIQYISKSPFIQTKQTQETNYENSA